MRKQGEVPGCPVCGGAGKFEITKCPRQMVTADVWQAIELAEFFERGMPPVAGGTLDQAAAFLEAARFIRAEEQRWEREKQ